MKNEGEALEKNKRIGYGVFFINYPSFSILILNPK